VDIAVGNPDFSTLVTALQTAGLVEALQGDGPFTVFAPTDAAFANLPAGFLDELIADPERLTHILLYHVNHGRRLRSTDLQTGRILTMQGAPIQVEVTDIGLTANQATVVIGDIEASNGIIHVIDAVLLPRDGFTGREVSAGVKNGVATVVWPVINGETLTLESATSPDGPWTPVQDAVVTADGIQKVDMNMAQPSAFFRLRSEVQ